MHRCNAFLLSTTCLFALFLALSPAHAQFPTRPLSQRDAVLVLDSPQAAAHALALPDRTLRCTPAKRLGVWIGGAQPLTAEGLTISGCAVGVMVSGQGHTVGRLTVESTTWAGIMCLGCTGSHMYENTIHGAVYGVWISGHGNILETTHTSGIERDAIFLAHASENIIQHNVIRDAGQVGIHVVAGVALEGPRATVPIPGIHLVSWQNIIRENDVQGSGRVDLRQWPAYCKQYHGWLENTWDANVAGTVSAWCLRGPVR